MMKLNINGNQEIVGNRVRKIKTLIQKAMKEYAIDNQKQLRTSPTKRRSDESSQAEQVEVVIDVLKKGYIMTKHSNSADSKFKFVYLSMSQKFLCWKSTDKKDEKRIEVCTISMVRRGGQKYLDKKDKKIKNQDCCLIIMAQERNLVLQASNLQECQQFEEDLTRAIKYCRKMSLNYVYLIE